MSVPSVSSVVVRRVLFGSDTIVDSDTIGWQRLGVGYAKSAVCSRG